MGHNAGCVSDAALAASRVMGPLGWAEIARGASSPGTTIGTVSNPTNGLTGQQDVLEFYVPSQWTVTVTLTNATFSADATAQPV